MEAAAAHLEGVSPRGYYNVQLYRGRRKVLSRWPHRSPL
jgi:hypothetical protein